MTNTQNDNQAPDEHEVVEDESDVHEAFAEGKITPEKVDEIDTAEELSEEADEIQAQETAQKAAGASISQQPVSSSADDIQVDEQATQSVIRPSEEHDVSPEIVSEVSREVTEEAIDIGQREAQPDIK